MLHSIAFNNKGNTMTHYTNVQRHVIEKLQHFNKLRARLVRMRASEQQDGAAIARLAKSVDTNFGSINKTIKALIDTRLITQEQLDTCYIVAAQQI